MSVTDRPIQIGNLGSTHLADGRASIAARLLATHRAPPRIGQRQLRSRGLWGTRSISQSRF